MKKNLSFYVIPALICLSLLAACAPTAASSTSTTTQVATTLKMASATQATAETTEVPTATETASSTPAAYEPVEQSVCQTIKGLAEEALGVEFQMTSPAPFTDSLAGESGQGCTLTASGTGVQFSSPTDVVTALKTSVAAGWYDLPSYQADGPMGTASAFYRDMALMQIGVNWRPDAGVVCPQDQPISACNLTPEQHIYTIELDIAQYKADFSLDGEWVDAADNFTLNLYQEWKHIYGNHVVVAENGGKIDSLDVSIDGMLQGKTATVTFQSSFSSTPGTAEITYVDVNTITWKIITPPDGEYYLPQAATLTRK